MIGPTPRQIEVAECVKRHGGNQAAAARELGVSEPSLTIVMNAYRRSMVARQEVVDEVRAEVLDEINERFDESLMLVAGLAMRLQELVTRLERLATPASSQRIADGGIGARRERRRKRAVA